MPTNKIGSVQFRIVDGLNWEPMGETVEDITRPGVDGQAWKKMGKRPETMFCRAYADVTSAAAGMTLIEDAKGLQGTLVTVYDANGSYMTNVLVRRASPQPLRPVRSAVGGLHADPTHDVEIAFELVASNT